MKRRLSVFVSVLIIAASILACGGPELGNPTDSQQSADNSPLRIVADPTVQLLDQSGILSSCDVPYEIRYLGSVEMKLKVKAYSANNPGDIDLFWAASPTWLPGSFVVNKTPIMGSYVVLGVDPRVVTSLNWDPAKELTVSDIVQATSNHALSLAMASSSQDDASANFYIAVLTALKGTGEPITSDDLANPSITGPMKTFYSNVSRGSNHSGDLAEKFITDQLSGSPQYNSFVLPEAMAIKVNQRLVAQGKTPMLVFYVENAVGLESFPIGYQKDLNKDKQARFNTMVSCLTSSDVQKKLQSLGFRTGSVGMKVENPDPAVFNPAWGINGQAEYVTTLLPKQAVMEQALNLYQLELRKSSCTVFDLDFSPSMGFPSTGKEQLLSAMNLLLDQGKAAEYYLQTGPGDTTYAVLFSDTILNEYEKFGNDPVDLMDLYNKIQSQDFGNGTNIYGSVMRSLQVATEQCKTDQLPAVILLTDGVHNVGPNYPELEAYYLQNGLHIPVYAIMIGDASSGELEKITNLTNAQLCDGRGGETDLVRCFRDIRGGN